MPITVKNSTYNGRHIPRFPSPVDPPGMPLSVNVCKIPGPPAPFVPAPLPNLAMAWGTSGANKQAVSQELKIKLQGLHTKITGMCGDDATAVHKALDEYVDAVSKLHVVIMGPPVKVEGTAVNVVGTAVKRVP